MQQCAGFPRQFSARTRWRMQDNNSGQPAAILDRQRLEAELTVGCDADAVHSITIRATRPLRPGTWCVRVCMVDPRDGVLRFSEATVQDGHELAAWLVEHVLPREQREDPLGRTEILDLLTGLVDQSLVGLQEQDDRTRYRFLETVRLYASERLQQSGEAEVSE